MEDICPIYFETRLGIHTFGMTKPIDVFILNKENEVIKIGRNIKPGRIFIWNPKYYKVLETAVNFINIKKLDKIIF